MNDILKSKTILTRNTFSQLTVGAAFGSSAVRNRKTGKPFWKGERYRVAAIKFEDDHFMDSARN